MSETDEENSLQAWEVETKFLRNSYPNEKVAFWGEIAIFGRVSPVFHVNQAPSSGGELVIG